MLVLLVVGTLLPPTMPAQAAPPDAPVWNVSVSVAPSQVAPGGTVTYTITVTNQGTKKGKYNLTHYLPAGFTRVQNTLRLNNGAPGAMGGTATVPTWPQNTQLDPYNAILKTPIDVWTFDAIATSTSGAYASRVYLTDNSPPDPTRDVDLPNVATVTVGNNPPVLQVTKSVDVTGTQAAGNPATYTITVTNTGQTAATGVSVVDTLPTPFRYAGQAQIQYDGSGPWTNIGPAPPLGPPAVLTFNVGNLNGNSSFVTITVPVTVGVQAGTWTNNVTVNAANAVSASTGPTAPVTVINNVSLGITKTLVSIDGTAAPPNSAASGTSHTVRYRIALTNTSGATATITDVTDDLPGAAGWTYVVGSGLVGTTNPPVTAKAPSVVGNTLTWSWGPALSLASGTTYYVQFDLQTPTAQAGTFNDNASVLGTNFPTASTGPTAPVVLTGPSYSIVKTASISTSTGSDPAFFYTVEITNTGNGPGTYRLYDVLPPNTVMVPWQPSPANRFEYDSDIAGAPAAALIATAPAGYPGTNQAQMTFPATGSYTIAAGKTDRFRFYAQLTTVTPGIYYNQATVVDTVIANAQTTTGLTAGIVVGTPPQLSISKQVDGSSGVTVFPLQTVTYAVTITHTGSSASNAQNIQISDTLPVGFQYQPGSTVIDGTPQAANPTQSGGTLTWTKTAFAALSDLTPGAPTNTHTLTFRAQTPSAAGTYNNVANVQGANFGNISTGPTATVIVSAQPNLTITKTANPTTIPTPGTANAVSYTIQVDNTGTVPATGVSISDTLPDSRITYNGTPAPTGTLDLISSGSPASTAVGSPNVTGGTLLWSGLPDIPPNYRLTLTFYTNFPGPGAGSPLPAGTYNNTASALGSNFSQVSTGPIAPVNFGGQPQVWISSAITSPAPALVNGVPVATIAAGNTVTYTITVTNKATAGASANLTKVSAILPLGMAFGGTTTWSGTTGSPPSSPNQSGSDPLPLVLDWNFSTAQPIAPGASVTLTYTVFVQATAIQAYKAGDEKYGYQVESTAGGNFTTVTTGIRGTISPQPPVPAADSVPPPMLQVTSSSAVGLANFTAVAAPGHVGLHWQTGSEFQNQTFTVSRGTKPNGPFAPIGDSIVRGLGNSATGGTYHVTDPTVVTGETYYYQLETIEFGGLQASYGPLKVKIPATGDVQVSLEKGAKAPVVMTDIPVVPTKPKTADVQTYMRVVAEDDTGITLRLVTPTVQVHTRDGRTQAIIDKLPLISQAGQYLLPEAVIPLGLPADVPYTVSVLSAADAVRVGNVQLSANELPPPPPLSGSGNVVATPTPPAVSASADPVADGVADPPPAMSAAGSSNDGTAAALQGNHLQFAFGVLATITGPDGLVDAAETAQARNQRILQLKLYPVQYDAKAAILTQYRDLTVRLAFARSVHLVTSASARNQYDAAFDKLLVDYDLFRRWEAPPQPRTDGYTAFGGPAFRVTVRGEGLYQLTAAELAAAHMDNLSQPEKLRLFYRNQELPLDVDAVNGQVQAVRFFAPANTSDFSRDTVLFLVNDQEQDGQRMSVWDGTPPAGPRAVSYVATAEQAVPFWFWPQMPADGQSDFWFMDYLDLHYNGGTKGTSDVTLPLTGVVSDPALPVWLDVGLRGEIKEAKVPWNNHVSVSLNGRTLGDVLWRGTDYVRKRFLVPGGVLSDGNNTVRLTMLNDRGAAVPVAYVDSVTLHYARRWQAEDGRLIASVPNPAETSFGVTGLQTASAAVYDVTDLQAVRKASGISTTGSVDFADPTMAGERRYWIGDATGLGQATVTRVTPAPALHEARQADYLVITPTDFMEEAWSLANYRHDRQGLRPYVVDVQQIYDEFAGGHPEPQAIRDFLAWTQHNWQAPMPAYVVLLGDGSFDYRNDYAPETPPPTNVIPPPLRASLHIGLTADDNWYASAVGDDDLPDLFIGRIPAQSREEARMMIQKMIDFEASSAGWRQRAITVADDNDPVFRRMTDNARLGYSQAFGWQDLAINDADGLKHALENGAGMTLFVGHGGVELWADEKILTSDIIDGMAEGPAGVVVAASCLTAYFDDPDLPSLGETMLRKVNGGAAAYLGGCGYTLPASQEIMLKRFYRFLLDERMTLGAAMTMAKIGMFMDNAPLWQEEVSSWTLLGDPAMTVAPPPAIQ
jgi:uncharacterized repeat protein (TIGR01451 family)/fimbrial isopeptide formation D2 family protein